MESSQSPDSNQSPGSTSTSQRTRLGIAPVIFIVGMISLLTDMSSEMIVPVLPLFLTTVLHVPIAAIGVIEGIAESTASVLKLFSGWISDRMGRRKPLMIIGYGGSNLIKPLFALCSTWGQVLTIRFADRFGKGVRGAPRDALIADSTTPTQRGKAFGYHRAMDTLGATLGPLLAYLILNHFVGNYRTVFWASAVPGILATLLLIFFLKEKRNKPVQEDMRNSRWPKISFRNMDPRFVRFTLVSTVFAIGNFSDAFLILRAQSVGMAAALIPLAYLMFNVTYTIFSIPAGVLSDRIGRRPVLVIGYLIFAVIYIGFGVVDRPIWVWVLFLLYGLYYAATEGIQKAYVADLVPQGQRGTAIGTFNAVTGLAALPASLFAGTLWQVFGPLVAFAGSSLLAVLAAALMLVLRV